VNEMKAILSVLSVRRSAGSGLVVKKYMNFF